MLLLKLVCGSGASRCPFICLLKKKKNNDDIKKTEQIMWLSICCFEDKIIIWVINMGFSCDVGYKEPAIFSIKPALSMCHYSYFRPPFLVQVFLMESKGWFLECVMHF